LVAYIYQKILDEGVKAGQVPAKTRSARNWFRSLAEQTRGSTPNQIINTAPKIQLTRQPQIGFMYNFFYDPKMKDTLPYYDTFPLIFPFKSGFARARAIEDKTFDENTRIRISYNILNRASKFRFFKPCVKKYLVSHVRSRFVKINADQWDTALFLPTERFRKKSKQFVYRESRNAIGR